MARKVKQEFVDLESSPDEIMADAEMIDCNASQSTGT